MIIACKEPPPTKPDSAQAFIGGDSGGGSGQRASRFTTSFHPHKVKRAPSPFAGRRESRQGNVPRSLTYKRAALIFGAALLLASLITAITLVAPKRPVVFVKRVSVPSTSSYSVAASGTTINVSGYGTLSIRLHNPNLVQRQTVKEVSVEVFWIGYQGEDSDYFDTAPLASGTAATKQFTLYPKDTFDTTVDTEFEHTGTHNVDPIWIDFIRRCLNQDEESRHLRLLFRVNLVVRTGWWGERRRRYLLPQDLPCPMTTAQIVELFRNMRLPPPEQAQVN